MELKKQNSPPDEIKQIGKLSGNGVFVFNLSTQRFSYVNAALVKTLELNKKILMEDPAVILRSLPEFDIELLRLRYAELLERKSLEDTEIRLTLNRTEKFLACSAYLSSDKAEVVGFVKDASKARQHEEYLVNFGARKDAILDMVSQNLSTPLNLSKFTVDLIEKAIKEKKYQKLDAHVRLMREVTSECIRIIDKFLQEEHLESPNVDVKHNTFDAIAKIMIVLDKLREANPDKQFKVTATAKHIFINADPVKYFQIIHNLLSNSIKFTRPNGLIHVVVNENKERIEVAIVDDGVGIPDDIKPYIFQKKTRAARPGLKGEISNGIGLYIASELTKMLNGKISFESVENKGTRFVLELPKKNPLK